MDDNERFAAELAPAALGYSDSDREYVAAFLARPMLAATMVYLTTRCPECGETPGQFDTGVRLTDDGEHSHVLWYGSVIIGCEGFHVVNPAALGLDAPLWEDWR